MSHWKNCQRPRWYNDHHIVARSKWWNNHPDNIDRMRITEHRALHTLFDNFDTITKIEKILDMEDTVLQWDFLRDIRRVLDLYRWQIYHNHVKRWKH